MNYVPAIDGLRLLAILLVMGCLVATVRPDRSHAKWLWVGVAGLLPGVAPGFALAALSWHFVENRFRRRRATPPA